MSVIKLTFNVPRVKTSSNVNYDKAKSVLDEWLAQSGGGLDVQKVAYRQSAIYLKTDYLYRNLVEHESSRDVSYDRARTVRLGGAFEEIGGVDEAVGGGDQKMGSSN